MMSPGVVSHSTFVAVGARYFQVSLAGVTLNVAGVRATASAIVDSGTSFLA